MDIIPFLYSIFENLKVPIWLQNTLLCILVFWAVLLLISNTAEQYQRTIFPLWPSKKEKERYTLRQGFCRFIEHAILLTNQHDLQIWDDNQFTELEAEVEAEGKRRRFSLIPFTQSTSNTLWREKSLTKALESSRDNFILLEGGPGSGKSVSLRHVGLKLVRQAKSSKSNHAIIPIIINLKNLSLAPSERLDSNTITRFVFDTLNYTNDPLVEKYLKEEYEREKTEGNWLFLFDSFDEIPEILGATDHDQVIQQYLDALSSFISMGRCRGIIASRYFNSRVYAYYPKFRILPLTPDRTIAFTQRANLSPEQITEVLSGLERAPREIRDNAQTPLFLSLMIDYIRKNNRFPKTTFIVYQSFVEFRLRRDCDRIEQSFSLPIEDINEVAQQVAFCMSADSALGLNPSRSNLYKSLGNFGYKVDRRTQSCLDALEQVGLATGDDEIHSDLTRRFTFRHRRFQEYFATEAVLQRPTLLNHKDLLSNPRWRETTITLLQILPDPALKDLIKQADILATKYVNRILKTVKESLGLETNHTLEFEWPTGLYHLFSLLQDGLVSRKSLLLPRTREMAGAFLQNITNHGSFPDRKWALEIAGIAPDMALEYALRPAIESPSMMMNDIAFRQVAQLGQIPTDIGVWIRRSLVVKMSTGELRKQRYAISAHYSRLKDHAEFLHVARLMQIIPILDFVNLITISLMLIFYNFFVYLTVNTYGPFRTSVIFSLAVFVPLIAYLSFRRSANPKQSPAALVDFTYALFSTLARLSLVGMALYLFTFRLIPLSIGILAGFQFYLLILIPSALYALLKGVVNRSNWSWLFSPFCLLFFFLTGKVKISINGVLAAIVLFCIAGFGLTALAFIFLIRENKPILQLLLAVLLIGSEFIVLSFLITRLVGSIREYKNFDDIWQQLNQDEQIDCDEFLDIFYHLQSNKHRIEFMEYVRKEKLLTSTVKTEKSVRKIISLIERGEIYYRVEMPLETNKNFKDLIVYIYKCLLMNGFGELLGYARQFNQFISYQQEINLTAYQKNVVKVLTPVTYYASTLYQRESAPLLEQATLLLEELKSMNPGK